jgi:hemerythrin
MIEWTPKLEVGHPMIDLDHYRLVADTNCLTSDICNCTNDLAVRYAINRLIQRTKAHFASEENLMGAMPYSEAAVHKGAHRHLLRNIEALRRDIDLGRRVANEETIWFVENWLVDHILTNDKKFAGFLIESTLTQRQKAASAFGIPHWRRVA